MTIEKLKQAPPAFLCSWIADAWTSISEQLASHFHKKYSMSNALDSNKNGVLWREIKGMIISNFLKTLAVKLAEPNTSCNAA